MNIKPWSVDEGYTVRESSLRPAYLILARFVAELSPAERAAFISSNIAVPGPAQRELDDSQPTIIERRVQQLAVEAKLAASVGHATFEDGMKYLHSIQNTSFMQP